MEKKVTKRDILTAIAALISEESSVQVGEITVTGTDIADYVSKTIEQLENKATKAKERAAEKRVEGDELRDAIAGVLTSELQTIDEINSAINASSEVEDTLKTEVTKSKITARLTQLVKMGFAYKEQVKTSDGRKVMAYAIGSKPAAEDDISE